MTAIPSWWTEVVGPERAHLLPHLARETDRLGVSRNDRRNVTLIWASIALASKLRQPRRRCTDCGSAWADLPSVLCPGCEAYRQHTGED